MPATGLSLVWIVYPLAFGCGAGVVYTALRFFTPQIRELIEREHRDYEEVLSDLFLEGISTRQLVLLRYAVAPGLAVLVYLGTGSILFGLAAGLVLFFAPGRYLSVARERRRAKIEDQVLDLINSFIATTKSGMNLTQSVEEVAGRMPPPIAQEFAMVLERMRTGQTLEAALRACDERLNIPNLSLVIQSIIVNEQRGGPLPELLEKLADSLREIRRVEERVKTETSGIKLSSKIMAAMPLVVGFMLYLVAPEHIMMLFTTVLGNVVLVIAGMLDWIGFMIIKKLGDLEV